MSPSQSFTHKLKSLRVTTLLSSFHVSMSKTESTSTTGVLAATQKLSLYSFDTARMTTAGTPHARAKILSKAMQLLHTYHS